jgi:NitT/TauT family transport system ATP-binding protein
MTRTRTGSDISLVTRDEHQLDRRRGLPAVEFRDVSVRFRGARQASEVLAIDRVTLAVARGTFTAIIGPSGCGKTTLLRLASGLELPSSGTTLCNGQAVTTLNSQVGFVTQDSNLYPWMTVRENVEFALEAQGMAARERHARSDQYLRMVRLEGFEHYYPHQLSGGMQKRVSIIRTLIYQPETVLMDEPFGALDSQTRMGLQNDLLKLWSARAQTVLFITHDLTEAISLSDRIVVMSQRPGTIMRVFEIPLARPREVFSIQADPAFSRIYDEIWSALRGEVMASLEPARSAPSAPSAAATSPNRAAVVARPAATRTTPSTVAGTITGLFSWINLYRALMLIGVLTVWEVLSSTGKIDALVFSHPIGVFGALVRLLSGYEIGGGTIYDQIRVTLSEMATGYVIGGSIGVTLGFVLGRTRVLARVFEPFILATYGIPIIALAPIFLLLFGIGYPSKVAISTMTSFFVIFFQTYAGVSTINEEQLQLARIMGASRQRIVRSILIPASLPFIFIGLRQAVPFSMTGAVIGEFVASSAGLGWFIVRASGAFDAASLFAALIIMIVLVWSIGQVVALIERQVLQWQPVRQRIAGRASIRT